MAQSLEQQLAQIANKLKPKIQDALEKEVFEEVKQIGEKRVQSDVYDVYEPQQYDRQYLLEKSWAKERLKDKDAGIAVFNTRYGTQSNGDRVYVAEIVETGYGYEFPLSERGYRNGFDGGERPFIENTKEQIKATNVHREKLKQGLKRQGIKVE